MRKRIVLNSVMLSTALVAGLLSGCGSSKKEGASPAVQVPVSTQTLDSNSLAVSRDASKPPEASQLAGSINGTPAEVLGIDACANCHSTPGSPINMLSKTLALAVYPVEKWSDSSHANQGVTTTDPLCIKCHDPFGDGVRVDQRGAKTGTPLWAARVAGRPVVGCEACHGGGSLHHGIGPLPSNQPGVHRCGACHNTAWNSDSRLTFHKTVKPEGFGIYEDYLSSPHASSVNTTLGKAQALCGRCHSDEGAKTYINSASGTMTASQLAAAFTGKGDIVDPQAVQCRTCHDGHNPGKYLGDRDASLPVTWSGEFKTCNSCHQLLKADGTQNTEIIHADDTTRIISDTHFSGPVTDESSPGYSIDPTGARACSNCHNPHKADNTINRQFATSNHFVLGKSWVEEGAQTSANCQRCHTTTGFINYMGLVAANNNGGATVSNTSQPLLPPGKEAIYCNACHTDSRGGLRNPKVWQYTNGNSANYVPPPGRLTPDYVATINGIGGSLLCAHCHMGRTTGQFVKNTVYTAQTNANNAAGGDHYYGTFGWMFRTLAYEYDGVSYDNTPAHSTIGTAGSSAPGNLNGPCVGCHMFPNPRKTSGNHAFKVIERDANGRVLSLLPYGNTCSKCHAGGEAALIADINTTESQYSAAIQAFRAVLASKHNIFYKLGSNPNAAIAGSFRATVAGTGTVNWPLTATDPGNRKLGAGFNLRTLDYRLKNKALFHNLQYTKRVMFDSIDFLDDALINGSVISTIDALTETASYVNETASEFHITAADRALAKAFFGASRP